MSININLNLKKYQTEVDVPFGKPQEIDVYIAPLRHEMDVPLSDFPAFINAQLSANQALIQAHISLNLLAQRLIVDTDPLLVTNMDSMTLGALDIGQDKTFNSI